jgi:hypothetical protein
MIRGRTRRVAMMLAAVAAAGGVAGGALAQRAAPETVVEAGPAGTTRDTTPSFTFGSTTRGATFDCRIEGPGSPRATFGRCSSPFTAPRLPSGAYVFAVQARSPSGELDPTPATRAFAVDAQPPETIITDGPGENVETTDRRPTFRYASEEGARFECRLGNQQVGGIDTVDWAICAADGFTPSPLAGGLHTFEVRAVDPAGNPDQTPVRRRFRVRACESTVRFGLVEAVADCLAAVGTSDAPRWESRGDVRLNGLLLPAAAGTKIVLEGPTPERPGGAIGVEDITLSVGGITLYRGRLAWALPEGGAGDEREFKRIDLSGAGERLLGLEVRGDVALRLRRSADNRYSAVLALHVALPEVFRSGPDPGAGAVTGDVAVKIDREGVHLDGLKVGVANAYVGRLGVRSICLSFVSVGGTAVAPCEAPRVGSGTPQPFLECASDNQADRWDGSAVIVLPTASSTEIGVWAGLRAGRLAYAGGSVDGLGSTVPLAPGIFLQRLALAVCLEPPPFQVKGGAGISFGPDFNGRQAGRLDGSFLYVDAHGGQPWRIRAEGGLMLFERPMANAWLQYQGSGLLDFGFEADLRFGPARLAGGVEGWVETSGERRFNVSGHILVCVDSLACANANAVISSVGAAGCITVTVMSVPVLVKDPDWTWYQPWKVHWESHPITVTGGAGYTWRTGAFDLMAGSCSIGPWQLARPARVGADVEGIEVPGGQTAVSIRVRGLGAPPQVTLVGPDGRRIEVPDGSGGAFVQGSHLIAQNEADDTTSILVTRPAGGRWRVEPAPDSSRVLTVERADAMPPPTISAGVGGRRHRRILGYAYSPIEGQRISFVERGPRGEKPLGVATGGPCPGDIGEERDKRPVRCGRLRFRPANGPEGTREIVAFIDQDGLPRQRQVVARYAAPSTRRPKKPGGVRVTRRGRDVLVRWGAAPGAARFDVVARIGDGRRLLFVRSPRRRAVRIQDVRRRDGVIVTVRAVRSNGVPSADLTQRSRGRR